MQMRGNKNCVHGSVRSFWLGGRVDHGRVFIDVYLLSSWIRAVVCHMTIAGSGLSVTDTEMRTLLVNFPWMKLEGFRV